MKNNITYIVVGILLATSAFLGWDLYSLNATVSYDNQAVTYILGLIKQSQPQSSTTGTPVANTGK